MCCCRLACYQPWLLPMCRECSVEVQDAGRSPTDFCDHGAAAIATTPITAGASTAKERCDLRLQPCRLPCRFLEVCPERLDRLRQNSVLQAAAKRGRSLCHEGLASPFLHCLRITMPGMLCFGGPAGSRTDIMP